MNTKGKEFVVSVADFAFYINGVLACTGVTNLTLILNLVHTKRTMELSLIKLSVTLFSEIKLESITLLVQ